MKSLVTNHLIEESREVSKRKKERKKFLNNNVSSLIQALWAFGIEHKKKNKINCEILTIK